MTPFDAAALLAMLLAFYPVVSGSELARARRERPEYFVAGTLGGSKGDKLTLPDGRVFDLIQNAGGSPGSQRWQVIPADGGGTALPWPLEPGPLTPIDVGDGPIFPTGPSFEALVGDALASLDGADDVLAAAATTIAEGAAAGGDPSASQGLVNDLGDATGQLEPALSDDGLADVIAQSDGMTGAIDTTDLDYDEAPPDVALPNEPDGAPYPGEDGSDGEPGRENPRHPDHEHEPQPGDGP